MQLLGRRYWGQVAVRELNYGSSSSRIRHRSCEPSDFGKAQANRQYGVSGRVAKVGGMALLLWLAALLAGRGALLPGGNSVTLAWNPSPDFNVIGYRLYYGTASHNYTGMISVGLSATASMPNLAEGTTYFFAVTAVNSTGLESAYSNEASYAVPGTRPRLELLTAATKPAVLRITGPRNRAYEIQATQNFTNWTVIGVVQLTAAASIDFTDVNAASHPVRFYRLRERSRPGLELRISPAKQVVLRIVGPPGRAYEVQATQTFTSWTVVGSVVTAANGMVEFTDSTAAGRSRRFYRLREIP